MRNFIKKYFPMYFSLDLITMFLFVLKLGGVSFSWVFVFIPTAAGLLIFLMNKIDEVEDADE